jgi:hypothetical protein
MSNLEKLYDGQHVSLTNSKCRFIRENWIKNIGANDLEYNVIQFSPDMWKKIIDLLHLKPSDFQLDWFTKYIFEGIYPEASLISECKSLNSENVLNIVAKYRLPYGYLKSAYKELLSDEVLLMVLDYVNLNDVIKDWDTVFNKPLFHNRILERMNQERLTVPYGEIMKRLISFYEAENVNIEMAERLSKIASDELESFHSYIEQPVVVFGDASASMDVAIMTSSIITSVLCSISNAKLHLFRGHDEPVANPPRTVGDVITMGMKCKANGTTAPVACLMPYLEKKEVVKTFIVVTDEVENADGTGSIWSSTATTGFANTFKTYRETVYPAKLLFVSFLPDRKDGQMVKALKTLIPGLEKDLIQFRLNSHKPDLRKLDALLNKLTISSELYDGTFSNIVSQLKSAETGKVQLCQSYVNVKIDECYEPEYIEITI